MLSATGRTWVRAGLPPPSSRGRAASCRCAWRGREGGTLVCGTPVPAAGAARSFWRVLGGGAGQLHVKAMAATAGLERCLRVAGAAAARPERFLRYLRRGARCSLRGFVAARRDFWCRRAAFCRALLVPVRRPGPFLSRRDVRFFLLFWRWEKLEWLPEDEY